MYAGDAKFVTVILTSIIRQLTKFAAKEISVTEASAFPLYDVDTPGPVTKSLAQQPMHRLYTNRPELLCLCRSLLAGDSPLAMAAKV